MSLEPRCRHGNIRSAEPCRDCDERDALRARVAELEAVLTRIRTENLSRFDCTLLAAQAQGLLK